MIVVLLALSVVSPDSDARHSRGVEQVKALWRAEDGDMAAFVKDQFVTDADKLDATFKRLEEVMEQLDGHFEEIGRALRRSTDLDTGPLLPVDPLLAEYDPQSHLSDDMFASKIAFVALLNFPLSTLDQRLTNGDKYTRRERAETRLAGRFARRVPAAVQQKNTDVRAKASLYIDEYNIWMHHVLDENGERLFPKNKKLISHWNLRDELKSSEAQVEEHFAKSKSLGAEFERMARIGAVSPDVWMTSATGAPVGPGPLLRATEAALPHSSARFGH